MPTQQIVVVDLTPTVIVLADDTTTVVERDRVHVIGSTDVGPQGPTGATGPTGPQGPAGVTVSATAPDNTDLIWVDTTGL